GVVLVGQQDHDDVGALDRLADVGDLEPAFLRLVPGSAALAQPYRHLDPGLLQVLRVRVTLRAVAENGDLLALDERQVGVFVVIDLHGSMPLLEKNGPALSGVPASFHQYRAGHGVALPHSANSYDHVVDHWARSRQFDLYVLFI